MTTTSSTARPTVADRLRAGYVVDPVTGCHVWQRAKNSKGYAERTNGQNIMRATPRGDEATEARRAADRERQRACRARKRELLAERDGEVTLR